MSTSEPVYYTERVRVPFSYWAIALFFGLTFVTAVTFMLGDAVLIASTLTATSSPGEQVANDTHVLAHHFQLDRRHAHHVAAGEPGAHAQNHAPRREFIDGRDGMRSHRCDAIPKD